MSYRYSLQDVLAYTPEELDMYLMMKDWACQSLLDKRKAVLMFLHADGLLTPAGVEFVMAHNFTEAVTSASELAPHLLIPKDYRPIVCLTHAVNTYGAFRAILMSGAIVPSLTLGRVAHPEWNERNQFSGVYMIPYISGTSLAYLDGFIFFTFSASLLDRSDFHINQGDDYGHITNDTWSQPFVDGWWLAWQKRLAFAEEHGNRRLMYSEVVFHHPVRIDETDRLIGIWTHQKYGDELKRIITECRRPDLLNHVKLYTDAIRDEELADDHPWTTPIEPQNPVFCTAKLERRRGNAPLRSGEFPKMAADCGLTPSEVTAFVADKCPNEATCKRNFLELFAERKLGIMNGTIPVPAPVYYPPFSRQELVDVHHSYQ